MSDSASLDNVFEFLMLSGLSLPQAMAILVPESFNDKNPISEDLKAFYEYHSILMEPWDGPAALLFSDGRYAGGRLENYVTEEADKTPENMDRLAAKIHGILNRFSEWIGSNSFRAPWDLAVKLEEQYPLFWKKDGTAE